MQETKYIAIKCRGIPADKQLLYVAKNLVIGGRFSYFKYKVTPIRSKEQEKNGKNTRRQRKRKSKNKRRQRKSVQNSAKKNNRQRSENNFKKTDCPLTECSKTFSKEEFLVDHWIKHHRGAEYRKNTNRRKRKRQEGGGQTDDTKTLELSCRKDVLKVNIPDIIFSKSCNYFENLDCLGPKPDEVNKMPPLNQINEIISSFNQNPNFLYVQLDYGIFDKLSVLEWKKLHRHKVTLKFILDEEQWFQGECAFPSCHFPINQENINKFKFILSSKNENESINFHGIDMLISELSVLCCQRWINDAIISVINKLLNDRAEQNKALLFNINMEPNLLTVSQLVKNKFTNTLENVRLIFTVHVGNAEGYTFLDEITLDGRHYTANHFSVCVLSFSDKKIYYADSLGWPIPEKLLEKMQYLCNCFNIDFPDIIFCHEPNSVYFQPQVPVPLHICSNTCSKYFFKQKCSSVCGISSIMTSVLATLDFNLFKAFCEISPEADLKKISYLHNISAHSRFLRYVVIDWIISGKIDLNQIYMKTENTEKAKNKELKINEDDEHNLKKPTAVAEKTESEQIPVKNNKSTTVTKVSHIDDKKIEILSKLDNSKINSFIVGRPQISFLKSKNDKNDILRFRCQLQNGKTINKTIAISDLSIIEVVEKIQNYIDSCELMVLINHKNSLITDKESSSKLKHCQITESDDWNMVAKINTGTDTKLFFEDFLFDFTKKYIVHKFVEPVYDTSTLSVSVTEKKNWGKTHRFDEKYKIKAEYEEELKNVPKVFNAVTLYINCSSKSDICRSKCGILLSELNKNTEFKSCPHCNEILQNEKRCNNCFTNSSPQWCKDRVGNMICKACYNYLRRHNRMRCVASDTKKSVFSSTHFKCMWQLKLIIKSNNLSAWEVFSNVSNINFHIKDAVQTKKQPTLRVRDNWDQLRIATKATPQQIFGAENRSKKNSTDADNTFHPIQQIKQRCKTVDKHYLASYMGKQDDIPINSDWRNVELLLESNLNDVLFFQRGDNSKNRCYHIVISKQENLMYLSRFGKYVIGYDVKQDFMSARFKTGMFTYTDFKNNGRAAAFGICNHENEESHCISLQILLANIPCINTNCLHESTLHVFDDKNGFFWTRPCSANSNFRPVIQHDKAQNIRNAVMHQNLNSSLCNFHGLKAFRSQIKENVELQMFLRPLETGFKCIMRSWNHDMTLSLIEKFMNFINVAIPDILLSRESKVSFINYIERFWKDATWVKTFTAEVFFLIPEDQRRDPLILTDNITERKFKEIDESDFGSHLNRSLANLVLKIIDCILHREIVQTNASENIERKPIKNRNKELRVIEAGLKIAESGQIVQDQNWKESGWMLINSSTCTAESNIKTETSIPDDFFTENEIAEEVENLDFSCDIQGEIQNLTNTSAVEHGYSVLDGCKRILLGLNQDVLKIYASEMLQYVPEDLRILYQPSQYICNILLCTCTCFSFISRGQPYFCKHLYACLSIFHDEFIAENLLQIYSNTFPKIPEQLKPNSLNDNMSPIVLDHVTRLLSNSSEVTLADLLISDNKILQVLHNDFVSITQHVGRPAKRFPHNEGFRRLQSQQDSPHYPLADQTLGNVSDPYRPKVTFPENSRDRHGGRKLQTKAKRGVSFVGILNSGIDKLGLKIKKHQISTHEKESIIDNDIPDSSENNAVIKNISSKPKTVPVTTIENKSIMCAKCYEKNQKIFCCSSKNELDKHLAAAHQEQNYMCAVCFEKHGVIQYFKSYNQLKQHKKDHTVSKTFKKLELRLNAVATKSTEKLEKISKSNETGIANLAKHHLKLHKKHKSASASELFERERITKVQKTSCAICDTSCLNDYVLCRSCNLFFHWKCVSIGSKTNLLENWICLNCEQG